MRMLWRIKDVALRDRVRSDKIGSGKITLTARKARLHQYGHILRTDEGNKVKQTMKMEVRGVRAKGRPRIR